MKKQPSKASGNDKSEREKRLQAALRANLKRRKAVNDPKKAPKS